MKLDIQEIFIGLGLLLIIFFSLVAGINSTNKTSECKEQAIANHYSVSDIEKICKD